MIRIGQLGDLHITDGPRFRDTARCIDHAIDDGNKQGVQLWLVGGDLTGTTVPHESFLTERNYLDQAIQAMASQAPVVIIRGNHDLPEDIAGYGRLYGDCPIYLANTPEWHRLDIGPTVQVVCLPYPDKAELIELGAGSIKDDNRAAADAVRAKLRQMKGELNANLPIILMAHINIAGCFLAGGEILADKEVELWRDDLAEFDADWTALSHIHLQQEITPKAWYAGSPSAQDFGAIDEKGYLIIDVDETRQNLPVVHRRLTPSRKMVSVSAAWRADESGHFAWQLDDTEIPAGAEVRVQVRMPEAELATCPTEQLAALMEAKGAHAVTVDRRVLPTNRVRSDAIASANTTADRVQAYWLSQGDHAPDNEQQARCLAKLPVLESEAGQQDAVGAGVPNALVLHKLRCKGAGDTIRDEVEIDFEALGDGITCIVGDNGCLVGDTLVDVPRDLSKNPEGIPIRDLVGTTPLVHAYDIGAGRIVLAQACNVRKTGNREVHRVKLRGSFAAPEELIGTADHPVMLRDGTYRPLGALKSGDLLMPLHRRTGDGMTITSHVVVDVEPAGTADVYDMEVPGHNNFVANGVVVHNSGKSHLIDLAGMGTWFGEYTYYDAPFVKHVPRGMRDAFSELTWSSGDHSYRALLKADAEFSGGKGKTEGYLWRDGEPLAKSGKITDYAAAIADVIPDRTLLLASVVAPQGNAGNFFDLKKSERKDMFMRALRLEHLQTESVSAGKRADEAMTVLDSMRREIARLEANVRRATTVREELARVRLTVEQRTVEIERAQLKVLDAESKLKAASDELVGAEAAANARQSERTRLEAEAQTVAVDLSAAAADIVRLEPALARRATSEAAAARVAELDIQLGDLLLKERSLTETLRPLDAEIATLTTRLDALRTEAKRLMADIKAANASVDALSQEPELQATEKNAADTLIEIDEKIGSCETEIEQLRTVADEEAQAEQRRRLIVGKLDFLRPQAAALVDIDAKHPMCSVCPAIANARDAMDAIEVLEREKADLAEAPATPTKSKIAPAEQTLRTLRSTRNEWQKRLEASRTALAGLAGHRERAARQGDLAAQLEMVRAEGRPLVDRQERMSREKAHLEEQLRDQQRARIQVESERAVQADLSAKLPDLIAECARREEAIRAQRRLSAKAAELAEQIRGIASVDLSALQEVVSTRQQALETRKIVIRQLEAVLRTANEERARLDGELSALCDPEAELAAQKASEADTVREIADWRVLERALGRDGVQALCLDQAGPVVSRYCNELLEACFDSRFTVEVITALPKADGKGLKEVFEVRLIDAESGTREKGSGGEMVLVNEALRLAISIWNVQQSGHQIRTLWRDEAAEGLSEHNQDRYVQMLRRARQLGGFQRVLLIAHSHRVWAQADAHIFIAPARGSRPTRIFTDQHAWRQWMAGETPSSTAEAA